MKKTSIKETVAFCAGTLDETSETKNTSFDKSFEGLEAVASLLSDELDVSNDKINKIEKRLKELNTNIPFDMFIYRHQSERKPLEVYHNNATPHLVEYEGYFIETRWFLSWNINEQSNSYRVIVKKIEIDFGLANFAVDRYKDIELMIRTVYKKPLIESKLDLRLQVAKFLTPFIRSFTKLLENYSLNISTNGEFKPEDIEFGLDDLAS